jgi:GGDEF domain-containing protein
MISIKRHIAESPDQLTTALVRIPYALLEALANHSVKYDPVAFEKNRAALRKLRCDLEGVRNSTEALQATGAIVRTIESYNRGVVTFMDARTQEMNAVITMCMGKMQQLADGNGASADNLRRIGQTLEKANKSGEVKELKRELAESLQGVQHEAARQQERSAAIRMEARELAGRMAVPAAPPEDADPATGLPGTRSAEKAMQQSIDGHLHTFGVLFAVGLGSVVRRFGAESGEEALAFVTKQIAPNLAAGDLLFRWKGPVLLALLERPPEERGVPPELQRMAALHLEFAVEADGKSVKIPLKISSISFHLWEYETLDAVRRVLDQCQQTIAPGAV